MRVAALAQPTATRSTAAADLLDFWLDHRLAVVVLLDRADGTPHADCPGTFVRRLVDHAEQTLDGPLSPVHREILELVFDNTRRALARILLTSDGREHAGELITAFWSYQLPGLDGLLTFLRERGEG